MSRGSVDPMIAPVPSDKVRHALGDRGLRVDRAQSLEELTLAIPLGARVLMPSLLHDWDGFGPIGVAMALLIWCGAVGTGWVLTACVGAVLWERNAPSEMVVESQMA